MKEDFDSIFGFVQNGVYVYDVSRGVNIYINKMYTDLLGYTFEELNIMSQGVFIKLFHPDDQDSILKHMDEISRLQKGEVATIEYRFKSKYKGWVWLLSQDVGYEYDNEGNMVSYIGSFVDISEQKQTETELKEITSVYRKLVENSPLGMHFYTLDEENQLIFKKANQAADEMLNVDNSQFIGKTIGEAFPPLLNTEVPEKYREVALLGAAWTTEQVTYADDKIIGAFKVTAFQTKPRSMVAVFDDITNRKQAERELAESEKLYRLLADTSTDLIARHNEEGVFLYASPACRTMLGYEPEELLGHSAFEYFHPDDMQRIENNRKKIIDQPAFTTIIFRFRKKDGEYIWLETNTHTIFSKETGEVLELHAASRDVSERVEAEQLFQQQNQKLRKLNSSKDKFFGLLSHDLRSPLLSLNQLLVLLKDNIYKFDLEKIGSYVNSISDSTQNLVSLVDDVLLWASSQSGRIPFNPQNILLGTVVQEAVGVLKVTAESKKLTINIIGSEHIKLFADEKMLKTILRNLVSNAIKFTNIGGQIDIKLEQDPGYTTVAVIDNGTGMTNKKQKELFGISEAISEPGTEGEKGTGIGLVICKEFVDKHKGSIWVDSSLGKGSTFTFKIPVISKADISIETED